MFLLNLLVAASGTVAGYQERPNIIVFLVDDMGLMDTSVPFLTDGRGWPNKGFAFLLFMRKV